jgi:hypothetical protein
MWTSAKPGTLARSWKKLPPDLEEDDLQGFANKEVNKSEITDIVKCF